MDKLVERETAAQQNEIFVCIVFSDCLYVLNGMCNGDRDREREKKGT